MVNFFKENRIPLLFSFLFFYLLYYPIISLGMLFEDDYVRSFWNDLFWTNEGRYASKLTLNLLTFTNGVDIVPLTHFLSILCMAITLIYACQNIFNKIDFYSFSLTSLFFLNPFYLQNMSYGYDNFPMTLSTCSAIFAALFIYKDIKYLYFICIPIIYILFAYQAALGIYINFLAFLLLKHYFTNKFKNIDQFYTKLLLGLIIFLSLSILFQLIYPFIIPNNGYTGNIHLYYIQENIRFILHDIKLLFYPSHKVILCSIAIIFPIIVLTFSYKQNKNHSSIFYNFCLNCIIIGALLIIILIASKGPSILLPYQRHAERVLIGISGLWAFILYMVFISSRYLYILLYILFVIFCFSLNYSYGFFLKEQDQYYTAILTNIHYDISHDKTLKENNQIIAMNPFPIAPINQKLVEKTPIIYEIYTSWDSYVLATPRLNKFFAEASMSGYSDIVNEISTMKKQKNAKIIESKNYSIYSYNHISYIQFH